MSSVSTVPNPQLSPAEQLSPAQQLSSSAQLTAARSAHWHQDEKPLLSLEALREWLTRSGLVLYAPRTQQLGAPTPSLVEATLGKATAAPELGETEAARTLLARMISDGSAVPLNLMSATGGMGTDVPDFVASAAVFSYIFTLRGNKAWKQLPTTAGPVKVSPLALAAYEMLVAKVTLSSYDLATQLGKEVTEGAVLRALTELWSQLRVIPVPQLDGSATLWELASARFTKQIKSGANAGQPTALSALISLYLGQALVASEDEIESFLSPLAPRSRVRDVIHALLSARQLETLVIEGKTLLHVAGEQPAFAGAAAKVEESVEGVDSGSRISKFAAKPGSKIGTGLRAKPAFGKRTGSSARPAFGGSRPPSGERERRPFGREEKPRSAKPVFNKPWEEDKAARAESNGEETAEAGRPAAPPRREFGGGARPSFGARPSSGGRPSFGARPSPAARPSFGSSTEGRRPERSRSRSSAGGEGRPPRREFTPREGSAGRSEEGRAPRKTFSKPGTFGRKREGFGGSATGSGDGRAHAPRREFGGAGAGEGRPPRREAGERAERPAGGGFKRPGSYTPRPAGSVGGAPGGDRPGFNARPGFGAKPSGDKRSGSTREGGESPRKIYRKFDAPRGPKPFGARSAADGRSSGARPAGERSTGADRARPERSSSSSFPTRPERSERPSPRSAFGDRPGGSGAKKPFSKAAGFSKAGGPFAKFADGKKPFRKPGAPKSDGPKKSGGGFGTTKRRPAGDSR